MSKSKKYSSSIDYIKKLAIPENNFVLQKEILMPTETRPNIPKITVNTTRQTPLWKSQVKYYEKHFAFDAVSFKKFKIR